MICRWPGDWWISSRLPRAIFELGIVSMAVRSEIDYVLGLAGLQDSFAVIV